MPLRRPPDPPAHTYQSQAALWLFAMPSALFWRLLCSLAVSGASPRCLCLCAHMFSGASYPRLAPRAASPRGANSAAPAGGSGHIAQLLDSSPAGEATLQQRALFGPSSAVDSIPA